MLGCKYCSLFIPHMDKRPGCAGVCVQGVWSCNHTCHCVCAFVLSVHRYERGSGKDQTVCISIKAKIYLKTIQQDTEVKGCVHSSLQSHWHLVQSFVDVQ